MNGTVFFEIGISFNLLIKLSLRHNYVNNVIETHIYLSKTFIPDKKPILFYSLQ